MILRFNDGIRAQYNTNESKFFTRIESDNIPKTPIEEIETSHKERYLELFFLLKEIASIASRSLENTIYIHNIAQDILNNLLDNPDDNKNSHIRDAVDALARKAGRPKNEKFSRKVNH